MKIQKKNSKFRRYKLFIGVQNIVNIQKIVLLLLLFYLHSHSITTAQTVYPDSVVPNNAFRSGEVLKYEARYGFIKGGEVTLSVQLFPHGGSFLYHSKAVASTAGIADNFFTIRDVYESYFDINTGLPLVAVRNVQEENYLRFNEVRFFRQKNTLVSMRKGERSASDSILDIVSAFYFARSFLFHTIEKNQIIDLEIYLDDEFYSIQVKMNGYEKVRTEFGKLRCLRFGPVIREGGIFEKEKDLKIWFTDDENYIPVKIHVAVTAGTLKLELVECKGLKNSLEILK
mgnify:CR=1 FL=1